MRKGQKCLEGGGGRGKWNQRGSRQKPTPSTSQLSPIQAHIIGASALVCGNERNVNDTYHHTDTLRTSSSSPLGQLQKYRNDPSFRSRQQCLARWRHTTLNPPTWIWVAVTTQGSENRRYWPLSVRQHLAGFCF